MRCFGIILSVLIAANLGWAAPLPPGYQAKVQVSAPTRIDWTFAASNRSLTQIPEEWLPGDFDSKKQTYECFVPPKKSPTTALPAILFVSAGNEPQGWKAFEPICKQLGMVFIGVRGAGNDVPTPRRIRIILDVLDDVRRQIPLDPDRTYVSGFSGGGRISCGLAFALPEYFGGIIPIAAGGDLRNETWLRHRAWDRLSIALLTGENDFNRGEIERWKGPLWKEIGFRTKVWVHPKGGHAIPPDTVISEAVKFLEEARPKRVELAKSTPNSRAVEVPNREVQAKAILKEGKDKLAKKESLYRGLMLLQGVMTRWPDLAIAEEAKKILLEYDDKKEKPWEIEDIAEMRKYLIADARSLGDYALNGVPENSPYRKLRPQMAQKATESWTMIIDDSPNSEAAKEGKKWLQDLAPLLPKNP